METEWLWCGHAIQMQGVLSQDVDCTVILLLLQLSKTLALMYYIVM